MSFSPGSRSRDEQALRRHRALADPSRARILADLADAGPLDARALAGRTGLHVNTVRVHLNALAEAGLVVGETMPPQGRGRPRVAYRVTGAGSDEGRRRYRLLAEILTALVARLRPDARKQLEEIGASWGRYLVASPPPYASLSDDQAVAGLLELLADIGFEPRLEPRGRGRQILMRPCPFLELAREHEDVICPIHLGLIRGALDELRATTRATKLEPFARPDVCVARLARTTAAA